MKWSICFILSFVLVIMSSCKEIYVDSPVSEDRILASMENIAGTKTILDEDNFIRWSEDDMIAAFIKSSVAQRYRVLPSSVGKTYAIFEKIDDADQEDSNVLSDNVLAYPYEAVVGCSENYEAYNVVMNLPIEQLYTEDSFSIGAYPMIAVSDDGDYAFRNVLGAIKIQLTGNVKVVSIVLRGNDDESLCGSSVIKAYKDNSAPFIEMSSSALGSLTLKCDPAVQLDNSVPTSFIFAIPPTAFSKGFTVIVRGEDDKSYEISTEHPNPVNRSSLLVMPPVAITSEEIAEGDYVDEYGVNHGQGIQIGGTIWAPVNCGYRKPSAQDKGFPYGKHYQWGRKYGQGYGSDTYSDASLPSFTSGRVIASEGQSSSNANVFFIYGSSPYDWVSPQTGTLWNSGTDTLPVKTANDPCPEGWRVPTYSELNSLMAHSSSWTVDDENRNGYWFSGPEEYSSSVPKVFLPASGYLGCGDGSGNGRSEYGYYWSTRPRTYGEELSSNLYFSEYSKSMGSGSRANGNSVRCVKND